MTMRNVSAALTSLALLASGCNHSQSRHLTASERAAPIAQAVSTQPSDELAQITGGSSPDAARAAASLKQADAKSQAQGVTDASTAVHAQVTLSKAHLFDRTFLYGFDLQYSSGADTTYSLIPQSQALGHLPATFRRVGDVLQLVGDQTRLFESNVNHPEILISEYQVVAEDAETISVVFSRGGLVVNEGLNGKGAAAPKQTWVRSLAFVQEGNYLLQETGLMLADGSVETVLESVFPRDSLVPEGYTPLLNDADREPLAGRYRFLSNEKVFLDFTKGNHTVRQQTQVANRFNLGPAGTIDWYVTDNAPDKFLPALKSGVEGWNRYFEVQLGRKVMRFLGRLPAGAKIGDPRYNVINWDSVEEAGAAYESQASDPTTGIQSHSLIYMPFAWYNIGAELWHRRVDAGSIDAKKLAQSLMPKGDTEVFGDGHKSVRCVRALEDIAATAQQLIDKLGTTGAATTMSTDEFGMRILTTTLFHEVGHALGLAHDFKGSLSYDGTKPISLANPTTDSIMDYNYYQHELNLFGELGTSAGRPLEYDRQIISQLYNKGSDVKSTDKVLPACEDSEADNTAGGNDPLCNRYDSENDAVSGLRHAYENVVNATGAAGFEKQTLTEALAAVEGPLAQKLASPATGTDADTLVATAKDLGDKSGELVRFYVAAGAQSLRGNVRTNDKSLRVWIPDALATLNVTEGDARATYKQIFAAASSWQDLPAVPKAAADKLVDAARAAILANPNAGTDDAARAATADKARDAFKAAFQAKIDLSLSMLRQSVVGLLAFKDANPFAVRFSDAGDLSHFEDWSAKVLSDTVLQGLDSLPSAKVPAREAEREGAAAILVTFKDADPSYDATVAKLKELIAKAHTDGNQNLLDDSRKLLKALGG